jgi:vancomycin resistance protein VanW
MQASFTPPQRFSFWFRSRCFVARRMLLNILAPVPRHRPQEAARGEVLAEVRSPLYAPADVAERELQLGKVENLRVAARSLDGILIPKGAIFSFWRQIGRPTKARGYVVGRELRQGCLIPTVAGGICQLSNSLYQVARRSGHEVIERHGHTQPIVDAAFGPGEDATVFWNYVDLRFRATADIILRVVLTGSELVVRLERAS